MITQLPAPFPQVLWLEDARGCDDARDQFRRRHVKPRVPRPARRVRRPYISPAAGLRTADCGLRILNDAPGAANLGGAAFFDRDVATPFHVPIDCRQRDRHVERDLVSRGEHGFRVGADLVGDFAGAAERAVAADDHHIDLAALHQVTGGVVGDDLVRDPLLRQFPGGQRAALATRPGLIAEHMEFFSLRLRGIHRGRGGADIDERQPAGVAMRQDLHAVADELRAVPADLFAMADVLVREFLRGGKREGLFLFDGIAAAHRRQHIVHRVDRIDSSRPRGFQGPVNGFNVGRKIFEMIATECPRALCQAVSRGGADRAGAAHDHVPDGIGRLPEIARGDDLEFVRKQALLDEQDGVFFRVKSDGPEMLFTSVESDVHVFVESLDR